MRGVYRWLVFLMLGGLLAVTALQAASRGLANYGYYPLKNYLGEPGRPPSYVGFTPEAALNRAGRALARDANNPDILRAEARLLDKQASDLFFWQSTIGQEESYRQSLAKFQQAARLRPVSPWLWADIALMKAKLGEYDELMNHSLRQAVKLGPRQPLVQLQLAEIGIAVWPELYADTRNLIVENIRRSLPQKSRYILQIAKSHNKMQILCENLRNEPQISQKCQ